MWRGYSLRFGEPARWKLSCPFPSSASSFSRGMSLQDKLMSLSDKSYKPARGYPVSTDAPGSSGLRYDARRPRSSHEGNVPARGAMKRYERRMSVVAVWSRAILAAFRGPRWRPATMLTLPLSKAVRWKPRVFSMAKEQKHHGGMVDCIACCSQCRVAWRGVRASQDHPSAATQPRLF